MPLTPYDIDTDIDMGRYPPGDREGDRGAVDPDAADLEPDRSVARHAEEADEAELAEEDILEIADLDDDLEAGHGDGPDA